MAEVVQHPSAPPAEPTEVGDITELLDEPIDAEGLAFETRKLVRMLKEEIGVRWMSVELRLQLEEVEIILGDRGTNA